MVGMPEMLSKGDIFAKLDERYKNVPIDDLKARLKALQDLPPYPKGNIATFGETGVQRSGALTPADAQHIRAHWFNDPAGDGSNDPHGPGWWRGDLQPVEPIIRQGLITAIDAALNDYDQDPPAERQNPLPIVFYWVCHAGHPHRAVHAADSNDAIEVAVSWSDQQVTCIIHTPDPTTDPKHPHPAVNDPRLTGTEPIFVVKRPNLGVEPSAPPGAGIRPEQVVKDLSDEFGSKGPKKGPTRRIIRVRP
jgi:hypothetical protein